MKFKNGKQIDPVTLIKNAKRYPRSLRRSIWKQLEKAEGITWADYRTIEDGALD